MTLQISQDWVTLAVILHEVYRADSDQTFQCMAYKNITEDSDATVRCFFLERHLQLNSEEKICASHEWFCLVVLFEPFFGL